MKLRTATVALLFVLAACGGGDTGAPSFKNLTSALVGEGIRAVCTQEKLGDLGADLRGDLEKAEVSTDGPCTITYFTGPTSQEFAQGGRVASLMVVVSPATADTPRSFEEAKAQAEESGDDVSGAHVVDVDGWTFGIASDSSQSLSTGLADVAFQGTYYVLAKVTDSLALSCVLMDAAADEGDLAGQDAAVSACNEIVGAITG